MKLKIEIEKINSRTKINDCAKIKLDTKKTEKIQHKEKQMPTKQKQCTI